MTREEELQNPGGIVHSNDRWVGMTEDQPDPKLVKFIPGYGLRALARNIRSYQREGINTLLGLAIKWAPRKDNNDPEAYAKFLADFCSWHAETPVVFESIIFLLVKGIVTRENGRCIYSDAYITQWITPTQGKPAMSDPTPPVSAAANMLRPSASKSAGALIGGAVAQLLCQGLIDFAHLTPSTMTAGSITAICIFLASHIIKD